MVLWKYNVSDYFFPSFFLRQHSHSCSALKEKKKKINIRKSPFPPNVLLNTSYFTVLLVKTKIVLI